MSTPLTVLNHKLEKTVFTTTKHDSSAAAVVFNRSQVG